MSEEKVRIRRMAHEPRSDRLSPAVGFAVCSLAVTVAVLLVTFLHSSQVQQSERLASVEKELVYWREKSQSLLERLAVVETKMQDGFWTGQTSAPDTEADSLLTPGGPKTSDSGSTGAGKDKDVPRIRSKRQAVSANTVRLPISGCMQGPPGPPGAAGRDGRDGVQGPPGPAGCGCYGEGVQRQIADLERGLDDVENKTSHTEKRLASLEGQQQEEIGSVTNPAVSCKYIIQGQCGRSSRWIVPHSRSGRGGVRDLLRHDDCRRRLDSCVQRARERHLRQVYRRGPLVLHPGKHH